MRPASIVLAASALAALAGCAPYPSPAGPPAAPPPAADGAGPPPAPVEAVGEDQVAPLDKPRSKWSVEGKSLSDVATAELAAAFMKAGLTDEVQGGAEHANGYDAIRFNLAKGDVKGRFILVRPAPRPTHKAPITTPTEAKAKMDGSTSAGVLDADADVYFEISLSEGGKAADAKRMLDSVIKK